MANRMAERVKNRKAEMEKNVAVIPVERIERLIFLIRGQKVMLDYDLADLYGVRQKGLSKPSEEISTAFLLILCLNLGNRRLQT